MFNNYVTDMQLPQSNILTTKYLNRVFDKTVATYKYYWFLGILDLCVKQGKTRMNVWDVMIAMVANAWYPVIFFVFRSESRNPFTRRYGLCKRNIISPLISVCMI